MPLSLELIVNATIPLHERRQENIHVNSQFRLEWAWGLPAGSLESYLNSFTDPAVEALLKDDKSVLAVHPSLISGLSRQKPDSDGARKLDHIDELYNGQQSFDYVVLQADKSPTISPWVISSPIPPHLTMGRSHMKLFLNALDPLPATFAWLAALFKLPATFSPSDATPRPNALTLMKTYYLYKTWICAFAPPSFIAGLPHPELSEETEESSESEESMYTDESAATYETPPRRLLPHEMARDPNARDDEDDDDDAITDDSHISGADGPEAYSKASLVRDHCMSNDRWVKGMASWVREAGCFDVDEKLIFNDEEVRTAEKEFKEQPRTVSSMHLDKPDYLRVHLSLKRKRTTD